MEITFDDQDKIIEIRTPANHVIKLDDKVHAISIRDANNNKVTLTKSGINDREPVQPGFELSFTVSRAQGRR